MYIYVLKLLLKKYRGWSWWSLSVISTQGQRQEDLELKSSLDYKRPDLKEYISRTG